MQLKSCPRNQHSYIVQINVLFRVTLNGCTKKKNNSSNYINAINHRLYAVDLSQKHLHSVLPNMAKPFGLLLLHGHPEFIKAITWSSELNFNSKNVPGFLGQHWTLRVIS